MRSQIRRTAASGTAEFHRPPAFVPGPFALLVAASAMWWCAAAAFAAERVVNQQAIDEVRSGKRDVAHASWWGFSPENATSALQAAIDSGAVRVVVENTGEPWIVDPVRLTDDQEVVFDPGVVVRARRGAYRGRNDSLFTADGKRGVTLTGPGATLQMWREDYDQPPYDKAEWRHVLNIRSCRGVRIRGLTLAESGGDGIYLGVDASREPNRDVSIEDVTCVRNYRQGISVISAENLRIERCLLKDTAGTAPMAGIDFEPNHPSERLVDCVMRDCVSQGNAGSGYTFYLRHMDDRSAPVSIRLERCRAEGNRDSLRFTTGNGASRPAVRGEVEIVDCEFVGGPQGGIVITSKPAAVCPIRFVRCRIAGATEGDAQRRPLELASSPDDAQDVGGVAWEDCVVADALDRPPLGYTGRHPLVRVAGVTGSLHVERGGARSSYLLTPELLDGWMPQQAFERLPEFDWSDRSWSPVRSGAPAAGDGETRCRVRGTGEWLVWAEAGERCGFSIRLRAVGRSGLAPAAVRCIAPGGAVRQLASAEGDAPAAYEIEASETGAYRIVCEAGNATAQLSAPERSVCVVSPSAAIHLLGSAGEYWFWVPEGTRRFGVIVFGAGGAERLKATLLDPRGAVVDQQDNIDGRQFLAALPSPSAGEAWRLRIEPPSDGVLEDFHVRLQGIPNLLAPSAGSLLKPRS